MNINLTINDNITRGFVDIAKAKNLIMSRTLSQLAFMTRKNELNLIKQKLVLRNQFTEKSLQVDKASESNLESRVGFLKRADYMALQEFGGIKRSKRAGNISMSQIMSRGGNKKNLVNRENYLKRISKMSVNWGHTKGTRKSRLVAVAYIAEKYNLFFKYNKNIYSISSFVKNRSKIQFKKKHLYHVGQKTATIRSNPTLNEAIKQPVRDAQNIFDSQLRKELRNKNII